MATYIFQTGARLFAGADKVSHVNEDEDGLTAEERRVESRQTQLTRHMKRKERPDLIQLLGLLIGRQGPLIQPAVPGQNTVWLLDNTAYQAALGKSAIRNRPTWHVEVVACVFNTSSRRRQDVGKFVAAVADLIGLDGRSGSDMEARQRIARRLQPFLDQIAPARVLTLGVPLPSGRLQSYQLGPTDENGICSQILSAGHHYVDDGTVIQPYLRNWEPRVQMTTRFAVPEGWLVVSDIDDTIKHTQTCEPIGILSTTFAEVPRPIAKMPQLYDLIDELLVPTWFYVSASPYNLYPFLRSFIHTYYRQGELMLRDYSWMDFEGLVKSFTEHTLEYKVDRIEKIHHWFPRRRVLCIGDSTQSDPEAYAELYRRNPGWIQAIFIRKVTDVAHMDQKNTPERFASAFEGVPHSVWTVFEQPEVLYRLVEELSMQDTTALN